jgi:general secretion pathway protein B
MSYILEALKKAQAERARGAVPGVDAQPVPTMQHQPPAARGAWIAATLALLGVGALIYWQGPWTSPAPVARVIDTPAPAVAQPAPVAPQPEPPRASPAPNMATTPTPMTPKPVRKLGEPMPGEAAPAAAAAPAPAPERIALLQDLPAQIQREIPALAINGYIYASNPADRSVLINNRLRREGDVLADGFILEKLLPREMVLNYRGYRYRMSY